MFLSCFFFCCIFSTLIMVVNLDVEHARNETDSSVCIKSMKSIKLHMHRILQNWYTLDFVSEALENGFNWNIFYWSLDWMKHWIFVTWLEFINDQIKCHFIFYFIMLFLLLQIFQPSKIIHSHIVWFTYRFQIYTSNK